ncbi:Lpg1974 family pore-forming outer membrane protein [Botrimarina sp.]|uniref:Lpg1974 family pore-forming outer membrane protein n=1 Tax=Botrimarina sp. TaxID=2795802 RepID=UPI0032EC7B3C
MTALTGPAVGQTAASGAGQALFTADADSKAGVKQVNCDSGYGCYGEGAPCGPTCDLGVVGGSMLGRYQVFGGGEWISLRSNLSEATAYRELDLNEDLETLHQFDSEYSGSYRVFGGVRMAECAAEVRFTYSSFDTDGGFNAPTQGDSTATGISYTAPLEIVPGEGDTLFGRSSVSMDIYDIEFRKTIPLGCPLSCGDCGDCGVCADPCGCGPFCPAWDITWIGGIRVADVESSLLYGVDRDPANSALSANPGTNTVEFDGVGLRFGMLGRRYFGRSGLVSAYVRGDISLLLGDVTNTASRDPLFTDVTMTTTQIVPVTDIEAGLTGYLTQNITMSVGYMLSAWHDLGHRLEYDFTAGTPTQIVSADDANLLTLDGFFIRAEAAF